MQDKDLEALVASKHAVARGVLERMESDTRVVWISYLARLERVGRRRRGWEALDLTLKEGRL